MKVMRSFKQAAEFFAAKAAQVEIAMTTMVLEGAAIVEKEAKGELGTYQQHEGKFPAWPPLSEQTKSRRRHKGLTPNNPLLARGELRDSIHVVPITPHKVAVGSNSPYAREQEHGTSKIPPRPFLGRAAYVKEHEVYALQKQLLRRLMR